jgi:AraC-like DNA-binding protein
MDETAWIVESVGQNYAREFDPHGSISFSDGPFSGFIERFPVRSGISLYRVEGATTHAFRLTAMGEAPAGNLVLGTMLDGAGTILAKGNAQQAWRKQGSFVLSLAERETGYQLEAKTQWQAVTLLLEPEALERLSSEDGLPPVARAVLDNGSLPVSRLAALNRNLGRVAEELIRPAYRGTMATLWREAKSLELLTHHLDSLAEDQMVRRDFSPRDLTRVREARERLLADLRSPPSLEELAAAVGLSARRLNQGFRRLYGTTVFDCLLEERMRLARQIILDGPAVPLKHLAWMVGYTQLSNFSNAYRRHFGVSPGRHRRGGESE